MGASWEHIGGLLEASWGPPGCLQGSSWRRSIKEGGSLNTEKDEDQQNSQKHLECLSDVSWKPFGGLLGRLGGILGHLGAIEGGVGAILGHPGLLRLSSEPLGAILEAFRVVRAARRRHHENPEVAGRGQEFEAPPPDEGEKIHPI